MRELYKEFLSGKFNFSENRGGIRLDVNETLRLNRTISFIGTEIDTVLLENPKNGEQILPHSFTIVLLYEVYSSWWVLFSN